MKEYKCKNCGKIGHNIRTCKEEGVKYSLNNNKNIIKTVDNNKNEIQKEYIESKDNIDANFWNIFSNNLEREIKSYIFISKVPLSGVMFEERIVNVLKEMDMKIGWDMNSHSPDKDIFFKYGKISCKSGKINNNKAIISSFRTTRFKTIEEKVEYINEKHKNFDYYIVLLKTINNIKVYLIESNLFCIKEFNWLLDNNGWQSNKINGISLNIIKKTSDQLWIHIDKNILEENNKIKLLLNIDMNLEFIGSKWKEVKEYLMR